MWIMLSDCFFSIVHKDCAPDELLVRARRPGDIEKLFPKAKVERDDLADYLFRARVGRDQIALAIAREIGRINYANFKNSVKDDKLHDAYSLCWVAMAGVQPILN